MTPSETKPLVSVIVLAYNHEKYIRQCLDSILMQQTTFKYEIIVGEDESSDGTREICIEYSKLYPEKICLFLRSRKDVIFINGAATGKFNFIESLMVTKGKYIALCEGDDYWISDIKLQKQVEFLEKNNDYSYCYSNSLVVTEKDEKIGLFESFTPDTLSIKDLLEKGWIAPTASLVFRSESIKPLPEWIIQVPNVDYAIQLLSCSNGSQTYGFDEVFAAYRKHSKGLSASADYHFQSIYIDLNMIKLMNHFDDHTQRKFLKYTNEKRVKHFRDIIIKRRIYDLVSIKSIFSLIVLGKLNLAFNLIKERIDRKKNRAVNNFVKK